MSKSIHKLRIIAGSHKGRKINFDPDVVRPTPDRIRETLFNWLASEINGASCLDLFSGSGMLGFEAISRGAAKVLAIEQNVQAYKDIIKNQELCEIDNYTALNKNAINFLQQNLKQQQFDIIFIDPPYHLKLLDQIFSLIISENWLKFGGVIYFEHDTPVADISKKLSILKDKKAGNVYYYLAELKND